MEYLDLYDITRQKTGHTLERGTPTPEGEYRLEFDSSSVSSAEFHISLENDTMTMERLTDQGTASYQLTRTDD